MKELVLDHGYVELIQPWGSDSSIIEAARMSTNKSFTNWGTEENPGDEKLLKYLYEHKHFTPFEMAGLIVEVKAPIFVFREWHRHRTQSYNEMSARYIPLPDENYIPTVERLMMTSEKNKQAGSNTGIKVTEQSITSYLDSLHDMYESQQQLYERALSYGIPKELARIHLPVGRYSRMRASANLRNWIAFLTLREDENAQWEIRQYAHVISDFIKALFPRTHQLYKA
ncbi:MAG: FAD-dependent thymidylate synthase [Nanoarchaeota archaeon]